MGSVQLVTNIDNSLSANISTVQADGSDVVISFHGVPGFTYHIQSTTSMSPPVVWTSLGQTTVDQSGVGSFRDVGAAGQNKFYRTVWP